MAREHNEDRQLRPEYGGLPLSLAQLLSSLFRAKRPTPAIRLRYLLALAAAAALAAPLASQTTKLRAVDASGEGLKGIVLVVDRGGRLAASAFVTDANGTANVPSPKCALCVVSAFDPKGIFYPATTEFGGASRLREREYLSGPPQQLSRASRS